MTALSARQHRTIIVLLCIAAALLVSLALSHIPRELGMSAAHAQALQDAGAGAAAPADPVAIATHEVDTTIGLIHQYGPIWVGMLIVFAVASSLLAQAEAKHWIAQGRVLAVLVAGVGVFGAFLESHFGGGQTMGIAMTAVLGVFKLLNPVTLPTQPKQPKLAPSGAEAGFVKLQLLAIIALLAVAAVALASCSSWSSASSAAKSAAIDCTKKELQPVVAEFAPVLESLVIRSTDATGKVDWSQVKDATKGFAVDTGGCVLAETVEALLNPPAPKPGAPASSPLEIDVADLRAKFEAHRAAALGGARYHTAFGDL